MRLHRNNPDGSLLLCVVLLVAYWLLQPQWHSYSGQLTYLSMPCTALPVHAAAVRSATGATVLGSAGRAGAAAASGGVVAAAAASASGGGLAVYAVLTRQQLALLREVPGDTTRVGVLGSELGVKLVGRGMDTQAEAMLEAIVAARKCSNTHAHAPS